MLLLKAATCVADPPPPTTGHPHSGAAVEEEPARFEEAAGHTFGFDDYTNWSQCANDYYSTPRVGRCTLPYASVAAGAVGTPFFRLKPISPQPTVTFSVDNIIKL